MKGIILAGGKGTRLYPMTKVISKQLLPVYDKPLIYYPLSLLMLSEIKDILIISTEHDLDSYEELLGDGSQLGIKITYRAQKEPRGLAEAFLIGEDFIGDDSVCLVLGDNIFYGHNIAEILLDAVRIKDGAKVFGYYVKNPEEYGVVEFNEKNEVISIEEKPKNPKSNYAIVGLYFYDNTVIEKAKSIKPSSRNEIEISDINKAYLRDNKLKLEIMHRGLAWLDAGSPEDMAEASQFIKAIEERQGLKIACIEEIAYRMNYINKRQLKMLIEDMNNSGYAKYLLKLIKE